MECRKWNVEKSKEMRVHHLFRVQSVNSVRCVHRRVYGVPAHDARGTWHVRAHRPRPRNVRKPQARQLSWSISLTFHS